MSDRWFPRRAHGGSQLYTYKCIYIYIYVYKHYIEIRSERNIFLLLSLPPHLTSLILCIEVSVIHKNYVYTVYIYKTHENEKNRMKEKQMKKEKKDRERISRRRENGL